MHRYQSPYLLFRNDFIDKEILFQNPCEIVTAYCPETFFKSLETLEEARKNGKWLAGYISFEAGYLLEKKLRKKLPENCKIPLLNFGIFERPEQKPYSLYPITSLQRATHCIFDMQYHWNLEEYTQRFNQLHEHLRKGNCYQACLTFPIFSKWKGDPKIIFDILSSKQPVTYGAIICLNDPVILSKSPELFFEVDTQGWIRSYPMKGTARRGKSKYEDEKIKNALAQDEKNKAENRMIVDLMRNDISHISEVGTLKVHDLFKIETYPTLHQMVSGIYAKLLPKQSILQIFSALFPSGSVTGAPKIRAIEIIQELEDFPRNIYCGSIGWISPDGKMRFNVAIRTLTLFENGNAMHNVGSGVVFDSDAENEYQECLLKTEFTVMNASGSPKLCDRKMENSLDLK